MRAFKPLYLMILVALIVPTVMQSQSIVIVNKDGQCDTINRNDIDSIVFYEAVPTIEMEAVDLGLPSGLLWASCDLGATSPEQVGTFFAWGETAPKDYYDYSNYTHCDGTQDGATKYNAIDGLTELEATDDAAVALLGDGWRTPSWHDWEELFFNTDKEDEVINGVACRRWISRINGKSIVIPCGGYMNGTLNYYASSRSYHWCREISIYADSYWAATAMCWDKTNSMMIPGTYNFYRAYGCPIRPVKTIQQ
jgi:hypothetical protein